MRTHHSDTNLIELRNLVKSYQTDAGEFPVLKGIDLTITRGEFVGVVGKSGSGKSTLINMITGIDRPTAGEIYIAGTPIHTLNEGQMAVWRGVSMGIVFQFFQLLPTLTVAENVMLPMDFCNMYSISQRKSRAKELLELVEISEHADKLPSQLSGGQQQRAAIARALANDPPIIVADEPTGNLDSKTADRIFSLFQQLVNRGKTIVMVTHDGDIARRLSRTLIISDGDIIEEYLASTFPELSDKQLVEATSHIEIKKYHPGDIIMHKDQKVNHLYVIIKGTVEIVLHPPDSYEFVVARFTRGQHFGEVEMVTGKPSVATVRVAVGDDVELAALDFSVFEKLIGESTDVKKHMENDAKTRLAENVTKTKKKRKKT
jgi:putative ABC transport system ATP-binding protein